MTSSLAVIGLAAFALVALVVMARRVRRRKDDAAFARGLVTYSVPSPRSLPEPGYHSTDAAGRQLVTAAAILRREGRYPVRTLSRTKDRVA